MLIFQDPNNRVHHENVIDLVGASCQVATDYVKRPYVLRLKLADGAEYLFQAKDEVTLTNTFTGSKTVMLIHHIV